MGNHAAHIAGVPLDQYCQSGEQMAEAQFRAWEAYGTRCCRCAIGQLLHCRGIWSTGRASCQWHSDIEGTRHSGFGSGSKSTSADPFTDGRMPVYLDAIQRLKVRLGDQVAIRAPGTGPFSLASHLMGTERFLLELAEADQQPGGAAEQALQELLTLTTTALTLFARACLDAGADIVQAGDSLASIDVISPAMYRKWAWPFERAFFNEIDPGFAVLAQPRSCTFAAI